MIVLVNLNNEKHEALNAFCQQHNIQTGVMLSSLVSEGVDALSAGRQLQLTNILSPVGLAADLIRASLSPQELEAFGESDTTVDDMENQFLENCQTLATNPQFAKQRDFVASLFLRPVAVEVSADDAFVESAISVLRENAGRSMAFREVSEFLQNVPREGSLLLSKAVASGKYPNVTVEKDSKKVNTYLYTEE